MIISEVLCLEPGICLETQGTMLHRRYIHRWEKPGAKPYSKITMHFLSDICMIKNGVPAALRNCPDLIRHWLLFRDFITLMQKRTARIKMHLCRKELILPWWRKWVKQSTVRWKTMLTVLLSVILGQIQTWSSREWNPTLLTKTNYMDFLWQWTYLMIPRWQFIIRQKVTKDFQQIKFILSQSQRNIIHGNTWFRQESQRFVSMWVPRSIMQRSKILKWNLMILMQPVIRRWKIPAWRM